MQTLLRTSAFFVSGLAWLACTMVTETRMVNEDGDEIYCYLSSDKSITGAGANTEYNRCLNEAGQRGYRRAKN